MIQHRVVTIFRNDKMELLVNYLAHLRSKGGS